jgi:8-oxo-dGTP pyrophosphatase MutT (NUDIX family)
MKEAAPRAKYFVWCHGCYNHGDNPIIGETDTTQGLGFRARREVWEQHGIQRRHHKIDIVQAEGKYVEASLFEREPMQAIVIPDSLSYLSRLN